MNFLDRHLHLPNQTIWISSGIATSIFCFSGCWIPTIAQPIIPADDGTNTIIDRNGARFDIRGGQTSGDGRNLFHSFEEFGLEAGQTANFLSNPNIENILGRVVGGNPSLINGLLQVSGSDANLFLINPAGMVFGSNASLNVAGDFTATTATGIGFGDNGFDVFGDNNWSELVGNPTVFEFATTNPGSIVNEGNLAVAEGHNLSVLGGQVVNTGELSAPGGNISIAAVPGESLVRLSATGNLLSLEVSPQSNTLSFTPLSLPELLTGGGNFNNASAIAINPDGTVSLTGSDVEILAEPGTAVIGGTLEAENFSSISNRSYLANATFNISGQTQIQATGDIFVESSTFEGNGDAIVFEADSDGDGIGLFEAVEGTAIDTNGQNLVISAASILLRSIASDGGDVELTATTGDLETHYLTTYRPTTGDGGNVTLVAEGDVKVFGIWSAARTEGDAGDITIVSGGSITSERAISANAVRGNGGQITLMADGDLIFGNDGGSVPASVKANTLYGEAGDIHIVSENGNIEVSGVIRSIIYEVGDGGNITIEAPNGNITLERDVESQVRGLGNAGTIYILAGGDITTSELNASVFTENELLILFGLVGGDGGDITVRSTEGSITINAAILAGTLNGDGGDVTLDAASDIGLQIVHTGTLIGEAGNISIRSGGGITISPGDGDNLFNTLRVLLDYAEEENLCGESGVACNADGSLTLIPSEMTPETLAKFRLPEVSGSLIEIIEVEGVLPVEEPEPPGEEPTDETGARTSRRLRRVA